MIKASGILLAGLIGLCSFIFAPTADAKPPSYPPFTMANTPVRTLPVTSDGRHYALYIGLPESYGKVPGKTYPVVYVTDGYWDFTKVLTMGGFLAYDQVSPEYITVGPKLAVVPPQPGSALSRL